MSYFVKVCRECKAINHLSLTNCGKCGAELPLVKQESLAKPDDPPPDVLRHQPLASSNPSQAQPAQVMECRIVDVEMPFMSMVTIIVKMTIAAIPALIILIILGVFAAVVLGAIGMTLGKP